jgi:formamidopyrimidine-DNA glycosylase
MPELPEVETLVRRLAPIVGTRIVGAEILDDRLEATADALVGASVRDVKRRAKYIVIELDGRGDLIVHLRMSGRLRLDRSEDEIPYTRMILRLDSGGSVYFVNPRRLGTAVHCPRGFDVDLGVEPTGPEFTPELLGEFAAESRAPIKQLLLDQRKIAGIGNIYAAEALWRARIDPRRPARSLDEGEISALHAGITSVLFDAIEQLGTTIGSGVSDYRRSAEEGGSFQNRLAVYGRQNEPCERCGTAIERVIQAGRSTCFCPACQT